MSLLKRNYNNNNGFHSMLNNNIIDQLFDDFIDPFSYKQPTFEKSFFNIINIPLRKETMKDGSIKIEFDVPGLDKNDINLIYEDEILSVTSDKHNKNINYKLSLPDLDIQTINATCDKGVLTVTATNNKQQKNKHLISIK